MAKAYLVRFPDGTQYGPAEEALLSQWAREGRISAGCVLVAEDQSEPPIPAASHPALAAILSAPPTVAGPLPGPAPAPMSGLIPYRNPAALAGYYMAVFSLIPGVGLLLGPAAFVCGIVGLREHRREPRNKGVAHSWVALILGGATGLLNWTGLILMWLASRGP